MKHAARLSVSLLGCRMLRVVLGKSQLRLVLEQAGLKPVKRFEMPFIALGVTGAGWFGTKDGALLDMQELTESDLKSSCGLNADEIARFKVALAARVHHKNAKNETRSTSAREHRSWSPMDRLLWSARLGFQQFGGGLRHVGVESLRDMFEVSDAELYAAGLRTLQVRRLRRSFAAMASRRNLTRRVHLLQNPAAQRRMLAALDDRSSAADVLMERTGFAFGADLTRHLRIRHGVTRAGEIGELHEADLLESGYAITSQTGGLACLQRSLCKRIQPPSDSLSPRFALVWTSASALQLRRFAALLGARAGRHAHAAAPRANTSNALDARDCDAPLARVLDHGRVSAEATRRRLIETLQMVRGDDLVELSRADILAAGEHTLDRRRLGALVRRLRELCAPRRPPSVPPTTASVTHSTRRAHLSLRYRRGTMHQSAAWRLVGRTVATALARDNTTTQAASSPAPSGDTAGHHLFTSIIRREQGWQVWTPLQPPVPQEHPLGLACERGWLRLPRHAPVPIRCRCA